MNVKSAVLLLVVSAVSVFGESRLVRDFGQPGFLDQWTCQKDKEMLRPAGNGGAEVTYRKFIAGGYPFPAIVTGFSEPSDDWSGYAKLELDLQSPQGKDLAMVIELRNQNGKKHVIMFPRGTLTSTVRQKVRLTLPPLETAERIKEMHLYIFKPATDFSYTIYQINLFRDSAIDLLNGIARKLDDLNDATRTGDFQSRLKKLRQTVGNEARISEKTYREITELAAAVETRCFIAAGEKTALKLPEAMRRPTTAPAPTSITTGDGRKMRLVWADEFNSTGLPEAKEWDYEVGFVRNNERQYYTAARPENVSRQDGCLVITARKENFSPPAPVMDQDKAMRGKTEAEYTAASVFTRRGWKHGRIEVRAMMPYGRGLWPAIWMMGTNFRTVNWPQCGEIDILEYLGSEPNIAHCGIHVKNGFRSEKNQRLNWSSNGQYPLELPEFVFHVYALEWDAQRLRILIDEQPKLTLKRSEVEKKSGSPWPFDLPLYLILNTAIGGDWGGMKGIDDTVFPAAYRIDYVRVYQYE